MPKMSPFQIVLLSVFALAALLGLYLFSTFKGFGGAQPAGFVTIWGTLPTTAVQPEIDDLKRTQQAFNKVTYVEKNEATFDTDLADALASGTGPDLVIISEENLIAERSKLSVIPFSSISERTYRDSFLPIGELFLTANGTFGIPFVADPLVLYYNRPLLASANIASPPKSWETVVGLAPTLTQKSDAGVISRSLIPLGTYDNIEHARQILSLLLLQSGSTITENGSFGLRSSLTGGAASTGSAPAESAVNFYTQFADPAKIVYSWNRSLPDARQAFLAGDAVFYVGLASERPFLAASNPNLSFDMAPIPQPQTATQSTDYAIVYAFAIPKASKNATGAYRAATALAGRTEEGIAASALSMAPADRSLLTPPANDLYAPVYYPAALISRGWLSPAPAVTDRIFADMINSVISGRASVHDALTAADQALTAALE